LSVAKIIIDKLSFLRIWAREIKWWAHPWDWR